MIHKISDTESITLTKSGNDCVAIYQVKAKNPKTGTHEWGTVYRKVYEGSQKLNIIEDMTASYKAQLARDKEFKKSKLRNYNRA